MSKRISLIKPFLGRRDLCSAEQASLSGRSEAASRSVCRRKGFVKNLALAIMLLCLLSGCQSKESENDGVIDTYLIGEESIPAVPAEDNVEFSSTDPNTYAYMGMESAGSFVEKYVDLMTSEENAFSVVNKMYAETQPPDFTQEKGSVNLAKNAVNESDKLVVIELNWSPGICTVVVRIQDGATTPSVAEPETLTHTDAADLIRSLHPSVLELGGESMSAYHVYIRNGLVSVNDEACIWVEIYTNATTAGTNTPAGTYYLSRDGKRLYILNRSDNSTRALTMK